MENHVEVSIHFRLLVSLYSALTILTSSPIEMNGEKLFIGRNMLISCEMVPGQSDAADRPLTSLTTNSSW